MNAHIDITGIVLKTRRLTLRPWQESDLNDFYEYASVDGVGQMAGWNPHKSIEESRMILDRFISGKYTFAIEFEGKVIGSLGVEHYNETEFTEFSDMQGRAIGYVLAKPYWGQGLMPEAVKRVIAWLFDDIGLDFINIGHFKWNVRSARVIEKCGGKPFKTVKIKTHYETVEDTIEYIIRNPHHN